MSPFDLSNYEPVEDRLRAFWSEHPDGRIETVLLGDAEGRYLVEARAYRDLRDPAPSASGLAMERETERGVNATSALENCETSAIGRALANLGYAPKGARPSREEMRKTESDVSGGAGTKGKGKGSLGASEDSPAAETTGEGEGPSTRAASAASGSSVSATHAMPAAAPGESAGSSNPETSPAGDYATDAEWRHATALGLTSAKAKSIAKGLGIDVKQSFELDSAQLAQVVEAWKAKA